MIRSFKCKHTAQLYSGRSVRQFRAFEGKARRKLRMLDAAIDIVELTRPPGNQLEQLKGDRKGQHSIRIDKQFRICFVWVKDVGADNVEIVDYH